MNIYSLKYAFPENYLKTNVILTLQTKSVDLAQTINITIKENNQFQYDSKLNIKII
jgi:hypothetical protein